MKVQFSATSTLSLVSNLKTGNEDFNFYPSTDEIISCVRQSILSRAQERQYSRRLTLLDIGAGDGRVITKLTAPKTESEKEKYWYFDFFERSYAIEKSPTLAAALNKDVIIIGTDFFQQSLLDKSVSVIYSNPPFDCYEQWAAKLLRESCASSNYLVIPERWKNSEMINDAIIKRGYEFEVLGNFHFGQADRPTRYEANVQVVHFWRSKSEAFNSWFDDMFQLDFEADKSGIGAKVKESPLDIKISNALVPGVDLVSALESIYNEELRRLFKLFKSLEAIEAKTLMELGVTKKSIVETLKMKIEGLKKHFWKRLFDGLDCITGRLISEERSAILDSLNQHLTVDFTASNAYSIVTWLINNASPKLSDQFVSVFERMIEKDNIEGYKSNERTFKQERWRYTSMNENIKYHNIERFKLDYRVVLTRCGGIGSNYGYTYGSGLSERAADFINDLLVVAQSVGFDTITTPKAHEMKWESNKGNTFRYLTLDGHSEVLFEIKAFKNGNMHIRFAPNFIMKMNVKFGQLKGWVKTAEEAAAEMSIPVDEARSYFDHSLNHLLPAPTARLLIAA